MNIQKGIIKNDLFLNQKISKINTEKITNQEGDIPAIHNYVWSDYFIQLYVIDEFIVGLSYKMEDNRKPILIDGVNFSKKLKFEKFIKLLNSNNIDWSINLRDTRERSISISVSEFTSILFCFDRDYYACAQLYMHLP